MFKHSLNTFISCLFSITIYAIDPTGAPPSLTSDVNLTACNCTSFASFGEPFSALGFFDTNAQVVSAFNFARRKEELAFGLTANSLGNLVLPSNYSTLSDSQKGLFIVNSERTARAGIDYDGAGIKPPILGMPFEGVDGALNSLSQVQANYMLSNNTFDHNGQGGDTFQRLAAQFGTQREFLARGENLYAACGGFTSHLVEQAIFSWLYQDAGSAWGHRAAIFIQDWDPIVTQATPNGFKDNYGPAGSEGFIGFGILKNVNYPVVCGAGARLSADMPKLRKGTALEPLIDGHIVVMMLIDPSTTFQAAPLPIDLISFEVKSSATNIANIEWVTASEINNLGFDIERSKDAKEFRKIGYLTGQINSKERTNYIYSDKLMEGGNYYYRFKQYDIDGKYSFSPIKHILIESLEAEFVKIWPNPVEDFLNIESPENTNYRIVSLTGKLIDKGVFNNSFNKIQTSNLPNGEYFILIESKAKNALRKFIVGN